MKGYIVAHNGKTYELPLLSQWQVRHTDGNGCDSFEITLGYDPEMKTILESAVLFYGEHGSERVFSGIVDEIEIDLYDNCTATVSGRGMAGLLLDNEAAAAEFGVCKISDVLERYVFPLGIKMTEKADAMPDIRGYTVSSGSSCMKALTDFTMRAGNVIPRFSRDGKLIIESGGGKTLRITENTGVFDVAFKKQRYGVISEAEIRTVSGRVRTVLNEDFLSEGGKLKKIAMVPKSTSDDEMELKGRQMIQASQEGKTELRLSLPTLFAAEPKDKIVLDHDITGLSGVYIATETVVWADEYGCGTRIYMKTEE